MGNCGNCIYVDSYGGTAAVLRTHLSNELRPWLRVAGHNGLAGSPVQTGSATLLCLSPAFVFNARFCVYRPLLCSTPAFVFIARFCVQRPLLCSTPAFVFNARFCVQRPQGGRSHRHGEALLYTLLIYTTQRIASFIIAD